MPRPIRNARWIVGRGWNQELWPEKRFPTAADLDAVVSDRPVWLGRVDGHAAVANSAAMKAAGVTAATPAPAGGRIENGLFVDAAMDLVEPKIPAATPAEADAALGQGAGRCCSATASPPSPTWAPARTTGRR